MIKTLRIRNLAIVENVEIEFRPGLNVITGETGAGKSILMGALELALGARADKDMIRSGEKECGIEAEFELEDCSELNSFLDEYGVQPCEDGRLLIRRTLSATGGGRILVNDASITLQSLKRICEPLVDFHGPHEHQSLIKRDYQLAALDDYGGAADVRRSYAEAFEAAKELERERVELESSDDETVKGRIEILSEQAKEIEEAALDLAEEEAISREHAVLGNAQRVLELTQAIVDSLTEGEGSAFSTLAAAQQALDELASLETAEAWKQDAKSAAILIQELSRDVAGFAHGIDRDPARMVWLDERLRVYLSLKRKYGASVAEVLARLDRFKEEIEELRSREERLEKVNAELDSTVRAMRARGRKLSKKRRETATRLSAAVMRELGDLGFAQSKFEIVLSEREPVSSGLDEIDFLFAPNKGEQPRSIRAIASSGEISRLMLALKSALSKHAKVPVMVFDEIDVNIGGVTARTVGQKLAKIADGRQVLCITHLPQVAVFGSAHFSVAKEEKNGRTSASISLVREEAREEEIARMLGGRDSTAVTLRHAQELLRKASPRYP